MTQNSALDRQSPLYDVSEFPEGTIDPMTGLELKELYVMKPEAYKLIEDLYEPS